MRHSQRGSLVRFVPRRMRSGRGRNVSFGLAAFAAVAAAAAFIWASGRRRLTVANY
jgi:hypothetical protein